VTDSILTKLREVVKGYLFYFEKKLNIFSTPLLAIIIIV